MPSNGAGLLIGEVGGFEPENGKKPIDNQQVLAHVRINSLLVLLITSVQPTKHVALSSKQSARREQLKLTGYRRIRTSPLLGLRPPLFC